MIYLILYLLLITIYFLLLEIAMREYYFLGYPLIVLFKGASKGASNRRNTNSAFGIAFEDGTINSLIWLPVVMYWLYVRRCSCSSTS